MKKLPIIIAFAFFVSPLLAQTTVEAPGEEAAETQVERAAETTEEAASDKPSNKLAVILHWLGLEVNVGFQLSPLIEETETILWTGFVAAYKSHNFFRDPLNDEALSSVDDVSLTEFNRVQGTGRIGLAQGLLYNTELKKNLLEAFLYYQVQWDKYTAKESDALLSLSSLADREGMLQNSFLVGLAWDNAQYALPHGLRKGYYLEASWEKAPEGLQSARYGAIDYHKTHFSAKAYLPLWDLEPEKAFNTFSGLLAVYYALDVVGGPHPSLLALQTFGGREVRSGLGGSVRGVDTGRFDSSIKSVLNFDLRVGGPALFLPEIIPGILAYADLGRYGDMPGLTGGTLSTVGGGLYIDFFTLAQIVVYQDFWVNGTNFLAPNFPNVRIGLGFHY